MITPEPKPLRLAAIELCDFRAFPGPEKQAIWLAERGRGLNLLLYGENGSGKSTIGKALRDLLLLNIKAPGFDEFRHIFTNPPTPERGVRLMFDDSEVPDLTWTPVGRDKAHPLFTELARTRGWFDYRQILRASVVTYSTDYADVFRPLVEELITECEMPGATGLTSPKFGFEWTEIQADAAKKPRRNYHEAHQLRHLENRIKAFNTALAGYLPILADKANEFLKRFVPWTEITLTLQEPVIYNSRLVIQKFFPGKVALRMKFRGVSLAHPGDFLNESRLSAIGLALHFAGLSQGVQTKRANGTPALRVLVLDDIIISLDMSHRRPLLDILKEFFADWQVLLLTHDRAWYELAKQHLSDGRWQHIELFASRTGDYEQPLVKPDVPHLLRAKHFETTGDTKAAAVHVRTEFELILKRACAQLGVLVPYTPNPHDVTLKTLWDALSSELVEYQAPDRIEGGLHGKPGRWAKNANRKVPLIPIPLARRVSLALSWVLNPLSHSETIERYREEVRDAVSAIAELGHEVDRILLVGKRRIKHAFTERDKLLKLLNWGSLQQRTKDLSEP